MREIEKHGCYRLADGRQSQKYSIDIDFDSINGLSWKEATAFFDDLFTGIPPEGKESGILLAEQGENDYDGGYTRATLGFSWEVPETDEEFAARIRKEDLAAHRIAEAHRKTQEQRERTILAKLKAKYEPTPKETPHG